MLRQKRAGGRRGGDVLGRKSGVEANLTVNGIVGQRKR